MTYYLLRSVFFLLSGILGSNFPASVSSPQDNEQTRARSQWKLGHCFLCQHVRPGPVVLGVGHGTFSFLCPDTESYSFLLKSQIYAECSSRCALSQMYAECSSRGALSQMHAECSSRGALN